MNAPLFSDRIFNIVIGGSMVRIELGSLMPPDGQEKPPSLAACQTIAMPLDGFVTSFEMMQAVMAQLVNDGVLKPKE